MALLLEPTPAFYELEERSPSFGWNYLLNYLRPYRKLIVQLALGLLLSSFIQLIFPFLTQAVVDIGIENQDIDFIYLILLAQLALFTGQTLVGVIQNWILLHIGTRINISLISDFLAKLMKLPLRFFDSRMTGDLLQRISDHSRLEQFLTSSSLSTLFAVFSFLVFSLVLFLYNAFIFLLFFIGTLLYIGWILFFLKKRKEIDYRQFQHLSDHQNTLVEMIEGMRDIKLQGSEEQRRLKWTSIQNRLFRANLAYLSISNYQDAGAAFINQSKNIIITIVAAQAVINGQLTLGMLLAILFITGQLNGPLEQFVQFVRMAQDAKISLERLGEVHMQPDERLPEKAIELPESFSLSIRSLHFRYSPETNWVLNDVSFDIPEGKITAIVGASGSGKSTLIKLLLGFYPPVSGEIMIDGNPLTAFDPQLWRQHCGAVLQEAFLFSDTIVNNITEGAASIDWERVDAVADLSLVKEIVEQMPKGFHTEIGAKGISLSTGQRQRVLIARALYKDPPILFFDEATNALDSTNERHLLKNLKKYFKRKTVIIVAHRLSTVKEADQILVLEKGHLIEMGKHKKLIKAKGSYYQLVKDQLELEK